MVGDVINLGSTVFVDEKGQDDEEVTTCRLKQMNTTQHHFLRWRVYPTNINGRSQELGFHKGSASCHGAELPSQLRIRPPCDTAECKGRRIGSLTGTVKGNGGKVMINSCLVSRVLGRENKPELNIASSNINRPV